MKCYLYTFSLFTETEKARDKRPPLNKPSNPTSQATPQVKQTFKEAKKQITQHAEQLFKESKQASTPPNKVNSLKKIVPQHLKQLFEENSTPASKATLRRKQYPNN